MSVVISVENLSKRYIIRHQQKDSYVALRDVIAEKTLIAIRSAGKIIHNKPLPFIKKEEFWALNNLSFELNQGDSLGIIGRNGAGKSTMLKVLSRITEPTIGKISIKGRIASLLEVGTGFHPELTGRENIFLNGAILGMRREEIRRKFDEIVDFSGVEKFLDTPVKRYSSGMYVRLAFAVAAHLESEILIVDEVLAVGDAEFQKKCLGKMSEVGKIGRTVLFVSHNLAAIEQLCNRAILLEKGGLKYQSQDVKSVIKKYILDNSINLKKNEWINTDNSFQNEWFQPKRFAICDEKGLTYSRVPRNDEYICIEVEGQIENPNENLAIGYFIYDENEVVIYHSATHDMPEQDCPKFQKGYNRIRTHIPIRFLNEDTYRIELVVFLHCIRHICERGVNSPSIYLTIEGGLSDSGKWIFKRPGILAPVMKWESIKQ